MLEARSSSSTVTRLRLASAPSALQPRFWSWECRLRQQYRRWCLRKHRGHIAAELFTLGRVGGDRNQGRAAESAARRSRA